jgi:hypothetical protein
MKVGTVRNLIMIMLVAGSCLFTYSCATDGYNTQRGAAIGALGGAIVGQAIGGNTASTLIGAATGALVGTIAGNAEDQRQGREMANRPSPPIYDNPPPPSGRWVTVPGQWVNGRWVPTHKVWVSANP